MVSWSDPPFRIPLLGDGERNPARSGTAHFLSLLGATKTNKMSRNLLDASKGLR